MLSSLFIAFIFSAFGLAIVAWTVLVLWSAIVGDTRGWTEKLRFKNKVRLIKSADDMLAGGVTDKAFGLLRDGFFLESVQNDADLIDRIRGHHSGIVSRLMVIAEQRAASIPNLAVVEDLLQSRCELMRLHLETLQGRRQLSRARKREMPQWAKEEYRRKLDDILDRLKTNRRSIESQLSETFSFLKRLGDEQADITIH